MAAARAITLRVNGAEHRLTLDPETPLLWALRDDLGLRGTRYGCGAAECGACKVLVDGTARPSCELSVAAAEGAEIETIEGLAARHPAEPLIAALIAEQAGQCGYCLPGIVIAARALLDANPAPTRTEIAAALAENLCRCGAHLRILRAIARVAEGRI
jgi:nicotinate dehydrogenase subunit A